MGKKYTGHCACGQVTYGFDTEPTFVANCHCTDCKRASGGQAATFAAVPDRDFTVFSGNTKSFSYGPNTETCAGQGLDRVFCTNCGKRRHCWQSRDEVLIVRSRYSEWLMKRATRPHISG